MPGAINWNLAGVSKTVPGNTLDINKLTTAGCLADGHRAPAFNDWANAQYNLRASLEFAGGGDTEQADTTAEEEAAGFASVDDDGNEIPDGVQCGSPGYFPAGECLLDVKAGDPLNIANLLSPSCRVLSGGPPEHGHVQRAAQVDPAR